MTWKVLQASSVAFGRWSNTGGGFLDAAIFCEGLRASFGAVPFSGVCALLGADLESSGATLDRPEAILEPFGAGESAKSSCLSLMPWGFDRSSTASPTAVPGARFPPSMMATESGRARRVLGERALRVAEAGGQKRDGRGRAKWGRVVGAEGEAHTGRAMRGATGRGRVAGAERDGPEMDGSGGGWRGRERAERRLWGDGGWRMEGGSYSAARRTLDMAAGSEQRAAAGESKTKNRRGAAGPSERRRTQTDRRRQTHSADADADAD